MRIAAAYIQIGQVQAPIWGHPRFPIQSAMLVPRCHAFTSQFPGGAEIVLTMLFVDVRGSTMLAEKMNTV